MMENKTITVPVPEVNTGIFEFICRTYKLLDDVYRYSRTPEGAILTDLDFMQRIDDRLNETVSTLTDCIGHEVCEAAQDCSTGEQPDNNLNFVPDERK